MISFPRRLSHCILKAEPLEQGGEYISHLDEDGVRRDYCARCWEEIEKPKEGHFWRGVIPMKKSKSLPPDLKALALFRETIDPNKKFFLALYLQRKQQLIQRTKTLYEIPETGEVFEIAKVEFSKEEGELIAQEIATSLDG